jgi:LysE type translocator
MPFDISVLPVFLAVSFVLLVTPGPDVAFIVATGVTEGRRPALWASVGISLAMFVHSVFAAAGAVWWRCLPHLPRLQMLPFSSSAGNCAGNISVTDAEFSERIFNESA